MSDPATPHTPPPKRRAPGPEAWSWWRDTCLEVVLLLGVVVAGEVFLNSGKVGSYGIHPNPYWLVVLPMAAARGMVAGFIAAAVATLLYTLGFAHDNSSASVETFFTLTAMLEPMLFFGCAFVVGEFRDVLSSRYRNLQRNLAEQGERNMTVTRQRDVLMEANRELEKRLVDHSTPFANLLDAAKRLEDAKGEEIFGIALELVEEHCGASASVLVPGEHDNVDMLCYRGWAQSELPKRLGEARVSDFVRRVLAEGAEVNGFSQEEEPPPYGPLVVVPIFDDSGVLTALLCLDEIPAKRLNISTVSTFRSIGKWISAAYGRNQRSTDRPVAVTAIVEKIDDRPTQWLGTPRDLGERLRLEYERCTRHGASLALLGIQLTEWSDSSARGLQKANEFIIQNFTQTLRATDAAYSYGFPGCYMFVLAGTSVEDAEGLKERLLNTTLHHPSQPVGPVRMFVSGPDSDTPDCHAMARRLTDDFRARAALPLTQVSPVIIPEPGKVEDLGAFQRRLQVEVDLAARLHSELHVVSLSARTGGAYGRSTLALNLTHVGGRVLRQTDAVYSIGGNHCAVMLPYTWPSEAEQVIRRLLDALATVDAEPAYGEVHTEMLGLGTDVTDVQGFLDALTRIRPLESTPVSQVDA